MTAQLSDRAAVARRSFFSSLSWKSVVISFGNFPGTEAEKQSALEVQLASAVQSLQLGRVQTALELTAKLLEDHPHNAVVYNIYGVCLSQAGQLASACVAFERACQLHSDFADAYSNLGIAQRKLGRLDLAERSLETALAKRRNFPEAWNNLGNVRRDAGDLVRAVEAYRFAVGLNPGYGEALGNLAAALEEQGELEESEILFAELVKRVPQAGGFRISWARVAAKRGRPLDALAELSVAIARFPVSAEARYERGVLFSGMVRLPEAIADFEAALSLAPQFAEAHFSLGLALLKSGDWRRGLEEYEWRKRMKAPLGLLKSDTRDGEGGDWLSGRRCFVYREQGLGDVLMFSRYLSRLADQGAEVVFACPKACRDLVETLDPRLSLVEEDAKPLDADLPCALMSLPRFLNIDPPVQGSESAYLSVSPDYRAYWSARLPARDGRRRIGVCWSANSNNRILLERSCALARFAQIFASKAQWVSVQKDVSGEEDAILRRHEVLNLSDEQRNLADAAAIMETCDLIITVDTSVAHAAGAIGKPTLLLLPYDADWRWFLIEHQTPWYPATRLFRQATTGSWDHPISAIIAHLNAP